MKKSINVFSIINYYLLILNPKSPSIYQINKIILSHHAFYLVGS